MVRRGYKGEERRKGKGERDKRKEVNNGIIVL